MAKRRTQAARTPKLAAVPDLDAELEALHGAPRERFTAQRDDLARRLRRAGQAEQADGVAALRKPSVAVARLNRLARERPELVASLLDAGERVTRAQTGRDRGASTAEAAHEHRAALEALGRELDGLSADARQRALTTLRLGSLEPSTRELLAAGRLMDEIESSGFDLAAQLGVSPAPGRGRPAAERATASKARQAALREARAQVRAARAALAAAEKEARAALEEEERTAARVDELATALAERERALDELQSA
jgi:DNA repair exonuclease SbcCD ATPase subunit